MNCTEPEIGKIVLLRELVTDDNAKSRIDKHLTDCQPCKTKFERFHEIVPVTPRENPHVDPSALFDYALGFPEGEYSKEELERIEIHLLICGSCSAYVQALVSLAERMNQIESQSQPNWEDLLLSDLDSAPISAPDQTTSPRPEPALILLLRLRSMIKSRRTPKRKHSLKRTSGPTDEIALLDHDLKVRCSIYAKFGRLFLRLEDPNVFPDLGITKEDLSNLRVVFPFVSGDPFRFQGREADLGAQEIIFAAAGHKTLEDFSKHIENISIYIERVQ